MIRRERRGAVEVVTIDRPERRNALDSAHDADLAEALRSAADAPEVRAIVLTGTGNAFCSGADLRDRLPAYHARVDAGEDPEWSFGGITGRNSLAVPIVAAVNGFAIGGGLELALACDVRLCSVEATFTMAEVGWAITPGAGGTQRLPRLIGAGAALDLLLTARRMNSAEALRVGLVSHVCATDDLLEEAVALAGMVAANGPLAVAAVRQAVENGADLPLADALDLEHEAFVATMRTSDAREGSTAFAEKRTPSYRGV